MGLVGGEEGVWPDGRSGSFFTLADQMTGADFAIYDRINRSFPQVVKYRLGDRGFYAEVCGLLNAAVYCLNRRTGLLVDETGFLGFRWTDFFRNGLPNWDFETYGDVAELTPHVSRRYNRLRQRWRIPVVNRIDRRLSSVFAMQSVLARLLCDPVGPIPAVPAPYAALQLRRGDKTNGYMANGRLKIESRQIPIDAYVGILRRHAAQIGSVFVLTDDYRAFDEVRRLAPDFDFFANCPPDQTGFVNSDFQKMDVGIRKKMISALVRDVHICAQAELFIGPFKSNPSRFVPLMNGNPVKSFSVDPARRWMP